MVGDSTSDSSNGAIYPMGEKSDKGPPSSRNLLLGPAAFKSSVRCGGVSEGSEVTGERRRIENK